MLDGKAQTIQALLRAFPKGADHPELALVRATVDVIQGRLDETAADLAAAEAYARTVPPDRLPRLRMAIAALKLSLARRRGQLDRRPRTGRASFPPPQRPVRGRRRPRQRPARPRR